MPVEKRIAKYNDVHPSIAYTARFNAYPAMIAVEDVYCTNPKCDCRDLTLKFHEVVDNCIGDVLFDITLDVDTWDIKKKKIRRHNSAGAVFRVRQKLLDFFLFIARDAFKKNFFGFGGQLQENRGTLLRGQMVHNVFELFFRKIFQQAGRQAVGQMLDHLRGHFRGQGFKNLQSLLFIHGFNGAGGITGILIQIPFNERK